MFAQTDSDIDNEATIIDINPNQDMEPADVYDTQLEDGSLDDETFVKQVDEYEDDDTFVEELDE